MGQYLTIGVATKISVSKERAKRQASASPEKIKEALELNYNKSGIYTVEETEDCVLLTLRPEIAEAELVDLLQDFYALRYSDKDEYIKEMMETLKNHTKWEEWKEIADEKRFYYFQQDEYVITSTPCPGGWTNSLTTYVEQILLSADGKIIMECWGDLFRFFTRLIKERLSKYQLADSLLVAISG